MDPKVITVFSSARAGAAVVFLISVAVVGTWKYVVPLILKPKAEVVVVMVVPVPVMPVGPAVHVVAATPGIEFVPDINAPPVRLPLIERA